MKAGLSADKTHSFMCMHHGLFYVKNHGKGTDYQKRKVEHLWRGILFVQYDTPEFSNKLTEEQLAQIKNYLEI